MSQVLFKGLIGFIFQWCFWCWLWLTQVGLFLRNGLGVRNAVAVNGISI